MKILRSIIRKLAKSICGKQSVLQFPHRFSPYFQTAWAIKRKILFWATLVTSILALITMFAGSFNYLLIVRTLLGASEGIILPISISMLAAVSRPTTLGRNMGLVYAGAAVIGVAIGPVVVTQLGELFDWRYAFLFVSLPSFIAAMLMLKVVKEVEVSPLAAEANTVTVSSILSGLKNRNILICTLISVFCMGAMWTFNSFLPLYLTQISQLSITQMGIVFSLFGLLTIVWQIFIPYSSDKIGRKPAMTGYLAMAMVTPLVLFIFPNSAASLVILVLFGGIILAMNTIYQSIIPVESVSPLVMASANALIMGVGELIGAFSIGFSGVLADAYSLTAVMLVVPISYFVAFLISFGLIETLRTKTAAKEQALVKATPEI
ncbi:MFS transporter [Planococcus glaciei]|nr:MFS transporter [Planococcus glaciei]